VRVHRSDKMMTCDERLLGGEQVITVLLSEMNFSPSGTVQKEKLSKYVLFAIRTTENQLDNRNQL